MLAPSLAQEIASDTSAVIGFNVLITDERGIVIGSGDARRVGTFHEASVEVLRTRRAAWHTSAQAHELRGVRPGITLPLVVAGDAVGTVGITGSPSRVRRFGLVVRRQTEILLKESVALRSGLLRERATEELCRDLAAFDPDVVEAEHLLSRARELGYELATARVALLVAAPGARPRALHEVFDDPQDIVAALGSGRFVVLRRHPVAGPIPVPEGALIGVGGVAGSVPELRDSYHDAADALRLGRLVAPAAPVHLIDDLRVHQALSAAGGRARARLRDGALGGLRAERDWPVLRETIIAWCEHGFNLVQAAEALHIHRNTLVYRLAKVDDGLRERPQSLYLACVADLIDGPAARPG
ncbi:sugar diacid utilization regulator [Nonomuraea sp. MG754425]|uniref:CdaR family transcriptional regulator n=1 Tax=Nonomuraea sp. MG754425 TaxID=2570319 RepID=UPI001F225EDD|nr:sugar diacid recognition domain-containing protein [Nonomuraea sp. MG754425]MCF6470595.1 sugar diacid utilization regulator [Nonomuraea sp. MG754425]